MAIKAEVVSQFDGFGNLRRNEDVSEHFRSAGLTKSAFGMVGSPFIFKWFSDYQQGSTDYPLFSTFYSVNHIVYGRGYANSATSGNDDMLYALTANGDIIQSGAGTTTPEPVYPHGSSTHFGTGALGGMIVDQKSRLIFAGKRYLGMADATVASLSMTVTLTNGSANVARVSGDSFVSGAVRQYLVVTSGSNIYHYRILTYTDANNIVLDTTVGLANGNYSAQVKRGWTDQWKDFGSNLTGLTTDGYLQYIPMETYEDTVLIGRKNNICTLNTLTDTVTTDALPAFNMPTGFDILAIHRGSNGILMGFNFQGKGYLVLWDNYSDRSIAPWIVLPDRLVSLCKYNGNWVAITSREFYETNGYTFSKLAEKVLDMDIDPLVPQLLPQTSEVVEDDLYFVTDFSLNGKRRAGVHKMNLTSKLVEYIPRADMNQYDTKVQVLFYGGSMSRMYVGQTDSLAYIDKTSQPTNTSLISNAVGSGENMKHAEAVKLNLGISPTYTNLLDSPFSFEVSVRVCSLNQQIFTYGLVKTTQTEVNQIVVNETLHGVAEVGDEIEFIMGNNAGYSRNITSRSGTGDTVTYTLDRSLPALSASNDIFFRTGFKLIDTKTFSSITEIDQSLLFFDIKNKYKGKRFLVKVDIEDATVPIEVRPFYFIYDDLGVL